MGFAKFGKSFVVLSESRDPHLLYSQGRMLEHETISPGAFTFALPTRCALRVLNRHGNNGRANQGDAKDQHGKCQNHGTQVDQPDRTIRVLGSR